jgi:ataxin-10
MKYGLYCFCRRPLFPLHAAAHSHDNVAIARAVCSCSFQVLLALVKRPDAGRALASGQDAVDVLQGMGLVEFLLGLLQSLGPPVNPRAAARQQQQQNQVLPSAVQNTAGQEGEAAEGPSGAGVSHQQQQQLPPRGQAMYPGYRSDLVSILGNCLCGRRRVQDAVLAGGGVELLLSCCQLDTAAPLAKEWALWAVRNLCEGNSEVQQYISELKVQDTVESAELDKLGKKLQLDKHTGKLKVVSKEPSDGPPADAPPPHPAQQQQPQ